MYILEGYRKLLYHQTNYTKAPKKSRNYILVLRAFACWNPPPSKVVGRHQTPSHELMANQIPNSIMLRKEPQKNPAIMDENALEEHRPGTHPEIWRPWTQIRWLQLTLSQDRVLPPYEWICSTLQTSTTPAVSPSSNQKHSRLTSVPGRRAVGQSLLYMSSTSEAPPPRARLRRRRGTLKGGAEEHGRTYSVAPPPPPPHQRRLDTKP
jgi:hypothetical protein